MNNDAFSNNIVYEEGTDLASTLIPNTVINNTQKINKDPTSLETSNDILNLQNISNLDHSSATANQIKLDQTAA